MNATAAEPEPIVWYCRGNGEVGNTPARGGHGRLPDDAPCRVCALAGRVPAVAAAVLGVTPKPCADCGQHRRCKGCGGH